VRVELTRPPCYIFGSVAAIAGWLLPKLRLLLLFCATFRLCRSLQGFRRQKKSFTVLDEDVESGVV
jgi:hypothetical protein